MSTRYIFQLAGGPFSPDLERLLREALPDLSDTPADRASSWAHLEGHTSCVLVIASDMQPFYEDQDRCRTTLGHDFRTQVQLSLSVLENETQDPSFDEVIRVARALLTRTSRDLVLFFDTGLPVLVRQGADIVVHPEGYHHWDDVEPMPALDMPHREVAFGFFHPPLRYTVRFTGPSVRGLEAPLGEALGVSPKPGEDAFTRFVFEHALLEVTGWDDSEPEGEPCEAFGAELAVHSGLFLEVAREEDLGSAIPTIVACLRAVLAANDGDLIFECTALEQPLLARLGGAVHVRVEPALWTEQRWKSLGTAYTLHSAERA
jgi:hypothetical protein